MPIGGWATIFKSIGVVLLLPIIYGYFFHYLSLKEPLPAFAVEDYSVFAEFKEDIPELKLFWDGSEVKNLYSTRVAIWNAGDKYLTTDRVKSKDPISIRVPPGTTVLGYSVSDKSRDDLDIFIEKILDENDQLITLRFGDGDALEVDDGVAVRMFFTSAGDGVGFSVTGGVMGFPQGLSEMDWENELSKKPVSWFVLIALGALLVVLVIRCCKLHRSYFTQKGSALIDMLFVLSTIVVIAVISQIWVYPNLYGMTWVS